jgi:hypothetical protein
MEKLKLEPDKVSAGVLEYECALRSIVVADRPVKDVQADLKRALVAECADDTLRPPVRPYDFETAAAEVESLGTCALKVRAECEELEKAPDADKRRKLKSLLAHFYARFQRFPTNSPELVERCKQILAHMEVSCLRIMQVRASRAAATTGGSEAGPSGEQQPTAERQAAILERLNESMLALGDDPVAELANLSRAQSSLKFPPDTKFYVAVGYDDATQSHFPLQDDGFSPFTTQSAPHKHKFQMHSWKLEFSGESDSKMSLSEFLERVEWKKRENGMSDSDLLRGAHNLFSGAALNWFKAHRASWTTFQDLREDLLRHFRIADYDDRVWEQLRLRSQAPDERLNLYVSDMMALFDLLESSPPESERLKFIKARLNPFTWTNLRDLTGIATIKDLVSEGLRLEIVKSRCDNYRLPTAPDHPIEPSLAPKGAKPAQKATAALSAVNVPKKKRGAKGDGVVSAGAAVITAGGGAGAPQAGFDCNFVPGTSVPNKAFERKQNDRRVCWNCDKVGHIFRHCPVKRANIFCWTCGKKGVTKSSCTELCRRSKNVQGGPARGHTQQGAPDSSADVWGASGKIT